MKFKILASQLFKAYTDSAKESPLKKLENIKKVELE